MYDERDSQILIEKMTELIENKREAKENEFSANFFTRGINQAKNGGNPTSLNHLVGIPARKLTREQELAKKKQIRLESKIRYCEFIKIVLDY